MSLPSQGKVLVVGAGIAGLTTAWALARRGFSVEVFDQGQIPNPKGASYDEHRITRHVYGEAEGYARLMPEAFAAYDGLFADIGVRPFEPVPVLVTKREPLPWFDASLTSLDELGIAYEMLTVGDVAARYPMIETEGLTAAFLAQGAGILYPTRILLALSVHLASRGVRLRASCPITAVDPETASVTAGHERHTGDAVIIAAGAWIGRLVPTLQDVAVPSKQALLYLQPPADLLAAWETAPVVLDFRSETEFYAVPPRPGTRLKIGDHQFTRGGDPDGDRIAPEAQVTQLMIAARTRLRDFNRYTLLESKACFYTVTDEAKFIVKPVGSKGFILSACSGHGFKLAPLMALRLADVLAGHQSRATLEDWAAAR